MNLLGFNYCSSLYNGAVGSQTSCPFPSKLKNFYDYNWQSRNNEWINTKSKTDYFVLSLSWSPTFCSSLPDFVRNKEFQCYRSNDFGLVVHGLWPQTYQASSIRDQPRNCHNEQQLPLAIIKRYYCLMPDEDLMQAEWEKHGSCYFKTATDYFNAIEYLFNELKTPDIRAMNQPTSSSIKNAFLRLNSPQLFPSAIQVYMDKQGQFDEIRICYDLQYNYISCRQ
ncbi:unnamed protein product [Rotaria socialis]|uniref:Uncharacterized protein n=1 Tax=Rotaria socialis TaxID=392032 RepID=A0A817ZDI1_9BILA|nr:unnamed protein product [Rotaria socialis]